MTDHSFVLSSINLLQRGWAKPFRPYEELILLLIIIGVLIIYFLGNWYFSKRDERLKEIKQKSEKSDAMSYLTRNGWKVEMQKSNGNLEFPTVFFKEYKKGTIVVYKRKNSDNLSVSYFENKKIVNTIKIKLNKETNQNMLRFLYL